MSFKSVFHRAVSNENAHTELLHNFLRYDSIKAGLLKLLEIDVPDLDDIHTSTQSNLGDYGRPDLELFKRGAFRIFIEVKIQNTALTTNQPSQYYRYLRDYVNIKSKRLVLLAPKRYMHLNDYERRLQEVEATEDKLNEGDTKIITWEAILKVIEKAPELSEDLLLQEYVQFLKDEFNLHKHYLNQAEMDILYKQHSGESFRTAVAIVFNVYRRLNDDGFALNTSTSPGSFEVFEDYGFSLELKSGSTLFFGIWFDYWAEHKEPFCLALQSTESAEWDKLLQKADEVHLQKPNTFRGWNVLSPDSSILMKKDAEDRLVDILLKVYKEMY